MIQKKVAYLLDYESFEPGQSWAADFKVDVPENKEHPMLERISAILKGANWAAKMNMRVSGCRKETK